MSDITVTWDAVTAADLDAAERVAAAAEAAWPVWAETQGIDRPNRATFEGINDGGKAKFNLWYGQGCEDNYYMPLAFLLTPDAVVNELVAAREAAEVQKALVAKQAKDAAAAAERHRSLIRIRTEIENDPTFRDAVAAVLYDSDTD